MPLTCNTGEAKEQGPQFPEWAAGGRLKDEECAQSKGEHVEHLVHSDQKPERLGTRQVKT